MMPGADPAAIQAETLNFAQQLIACRSVTPSDGGSLEVVASRLAPLGFHCERLDRGGIANLWARHGSAAPVVCLAGHVDVVPTGPLDQWTVDPFAGVVRDGLLIGRGAADMKGSVAAMVTAARRIAADSPDHPGSIAVLLTSDEEGDALHGTMAVVDALRARGDGIDACIVGEPTSSERLGDTLKNGRRGSLNGVLTVKGVQGHVAYPDRVRNPIHLAAPAIATLCAQEWDHGNAYFGPTSFQISNIHAGTGANNVVPGALEVTFNFRFSPESPVGTLTSRVQAVLEAHGLDCELVWTVNAEPFLTPAGRLVEAVRSAVASVTGVDAALSTSGGTSDGRFLATLAREVVEFGPINESIHKIDERIAVADLGPLSTIYERAVRALLGT
jgi:succinyl-diaminopimelate desuccinylase